MHIELSFKKVVVNYNLSLAEMIVLGNYRLQPDKEWINDRNFKVVGRGVVNCELVLVMFGQNITITEAAQHIEELGLLPAEIEHVLAFGATYPETQREKLIISLGAGCRRDNRHCTPVLSEWSYKRELRLISAEPHRVLLDGLTAFIARRK